MMAKVFGSPLSPYVRKVLVTLEIKGVDYDNDPFSPINKPAGYEKISPLGKLPAYQEEDFTLADSSVICAYLDLQYPDPSLYPQAAKARARSLWFEEYADTKLAELLLRGVFFQCCIKPKLLKQTADENKVNHIITTTLPPVLDYLEGQVPTTGFIVDEALSLGDISLVSQLINGQYADYRLDGSRWPKLADYTNRVLVHPIISQRLAREKALATQLDLAPIAPTA
jgi:glutathione S-transferase